MLFTVAICDDDKVFCRQLNDMVESYLKELGIKYQILIYNTVQNIRYELAEGMIFDVLFLDLKFPLEQRDGVYLGNYLRDTLQNDYSQIIYISGIEGYAMQLFESRPLNFLLKPIRKDKLQKTLDKVMYLQDINKKIFTYTFGSKEFRLELGEILYFESEGRKIKIVCKGGKEYSYNGKISNVYEKLKDSKFFSPHKSFVVNYHAVEQWSRDELILLDGERIPVSRNKISEVRELQLKYERG